MIGACDIFEAAAGAPAGSFVERTERVTHVTRDGVLLSDVLDDPSPTGTFNPPYVAYKCFWASLSGNRDEHWQKWPYAGLDKLPAEVVETLTADGWTPSQNGRLLPKRGDLLLRRLHG